MSRIKWNPLEHPSKLTDEQLVEKYNFYRFVLAWTAENERNEIYDRIADLVDEMKNRKLIDK